MISALFALLVAATPAQATPPLQNAAQIKDALDTRLTDYPSARFRRVQVSEDGTMICGEVNGKSPAGGYEGWKAMIIVNAQTAPDVQIAQAPAVAREFQSRCSSRSDWRSADYTSALVHTD